MVENTYFSGNGLYQTKLDQLVKRREKTIELTAVNEMYCIIILMLKSEVGEEKVKKVIEKYKEYIPEYKYVLNKLIESPSYNLAEWVFDYIILDLWKKWI